MPALKSAVKRFVPTSIYRTVRRWWRRRTVDTSAANTLFALRPVSRIWGLDRGTAIDHYYIEQFLTAHAQDIHGRTLEMGDPRYTRKFGANRVAKSDVMHLVPGNPRATLIGDLATGEGVLDQSFDCLIVINTLLLIFDVRSAIANCYRSLKPGGVLLAHFTGITSTCPEDAAWAGDYWRFTSGSARRLCEEFFSPAHVTVNVYGNVRTATAYLYGLAAEDLQPEELDYHDPNYELVIAVRAVKPS